MKKWIGSGVLVATLTVLCVAQSPWDQLRQKAATAAKAASANRGLSNDKIVAGLKEALTVSTRNAVAATGRTDGFLKNEAIRILDRKSTRLNSSHVRISYAV